MIRKSLLVLVCAAMLAPSIAWAQDAKAFVGDWVLTIEGRRGPQERPLTIKDTGGKLTVIRGQTVAPFDTTAFLLSTNQVSRPIKTEYGYHVIQPISAIKPAKVTPLKDAKPLPSSD